MIKIIIRQTPVSQPRPRVTRWGCFDPSKEKKAWAKMQIADQIKNPLDQPIYLKIFFYMPIPKSTSKKKQKLMEDGLIKHTKRFDLDNLLKFALDSMNEIAFKDDSQVYKVEAEKLYSHDPRTEIYMEEYNG